MKVRNLVLVVGVFLFFSQKSYAYLDPGTGSMVFQVVVASFVAFVCAFRGFFSKFFKKKEKDDEQ